MPRSLRKVHAGRHAGLHARLVPGQTRPAVQRRRAGRADDSLPGAGQVGTAVCESGAAIHAPRTRRHCRLWLAVRGEAGHAMTGLLDPDGTLPEPAEDLAAQLAAIADPASTKSTMFLAAGSPEPARLPSGVGT